MGEHDCIDINATSLVLFAIVVCVPLLLLVSIDLDPIHQVQLDKQMLINPSEKKEEEKKNTNLQHEISKSNYNTIIIQQQLRLTGIYIFQISFISNS